MIVLLVKRPGKWAIASKHPVSQGPAQEGLAHNREGVPPPASFCSSVVGRAAKFPSAEKKIPGGSNIHYPHRADVPFGKCVHLNTSGPSITPPILALRHVAGGAEGLGLCLLCAGMPLAVNGRGRPSRVHMSGGHLPVTTHIYPSGALG